MKKSLVLFALVSMFIIGCSSNRASSHRYTKGEFYVPTNWNQPIGSQKSSSFSKKGWFSSLGERSWSKYSFQGDKFQPNFDDKGSKWVSSNVPQDQMVGRASWYGPGFHGKKTANGERYNQNMMTAAHRYLPMDTIVRVKNVQNGKTIVVRINDRGPYKKNRILDLSKTGAQKLGFIEQGTTEVALEVVSFPKDFDPAKGLTPYRQVVVQLAVFKNAKYANQLKDKLSRRYQRIPFHVDRLNPGAYHVVAGPYNQRDKALEIANALESEGIENFVRSYRK